MNFTIIKHTENYKDILKYVVCGRLKIPEELHIVCNNEIKIIPLLYTFYYDDKIECKTIKINYDNLQINKQFNDLVHEYLLKNYQCEDINSTFIDTEIKLRFVSITQNFEDSDAKHGEINSYETLIIILNGVRTEINFNFSCTIDWSNGINNENLDIKYKNKVTTDIDQQIQEFIKKNCKHYKNASNKNYPYFRTNLSSFEIKNKIKKKVIRK